MIGFVQSHPLQAASLIALASLAALAACIWLASVVKGDVSIVDSVCSLMILLAAIIYATVMPEVSTRAGVVLALVTLWAIRLAVYIRWRNWGKGEDRRYQAIRGREVVDGCVISFAYWNPEILR